MVVALANWQNDRHTTKQIMRPAIAILVILSLALGGGLLMRHKKAAEQAQLDQIQIAVLSNDLVKASSQRDELQRISLILETNLTLRGSEVSEFSNKLVSISPSFHPA